MALTSAARPAEPAGPFFLAIGGVVVGLGLWIGEPLHGFSGSAYQNHLLICNHSVFALNFCLCLDKHPYLSMTRKERNFEVLDQKFS